jgi:signal peptidase II
MLQSSLKCGGNLTVNRMVRLILVTALLLGCVGCDQVTKAAARARLSDAPAVSWLHDTFRLVYAENPGAFLSLGASLSKPMRIAVFQGGVSLLVLGLVAAALFWRGLDRLHIVALTLLAASGMGNLLDRILYEGRVTDFLNVGVGNLRTGIFNVADVLGVVGVIMLIVHRKADAPPDPWRDQ